VPPHLAVRQAELLAGREKTIRWPDKRERSAGVRSTHAEHHRSLRCPGLFTRLSLAPMGADTVLDPAETDVEAWIKKETNGMGVDVLLEMSGNAAASFVHG
jgi:hypothetical protein